MTDGTPSRTASVSPGPGSGTNGEGTPAPTLPAPTITITSTQQVRVGFKCYVEKNGEKRLAEILSTHVRKGNLEFYVHYEDFNKRLDEWVSESRIDLSQPVTLPRPEKPKKSGSETPKAGPHNKVGKKSTKKTTKAAAAAAAAAARHSGVSTPKNKKIGAGKENEEPVSTPGNADVMDLDDIKVNTQQDPDDFNREEEIEKLRTSGSMTQNAHEVARVRNVSKIIMGENEIEPWYFSPYPIELTEEDQIYICEFSLSYFGSKKQFERFRSKSTLRHPPGNEIYRDENVSFFEIDGRRQRTWCRNLCLLSKLFLDHKTLYYDVDPFLFYCMTKRDEMGHHLVGYFSKEKESAEGYNVACILTLPQYQRHGYGRVLIDFSYNLSKKEGKVGSPEKPLSDLGLLSYRAYWADSIVELLIESGKNDTTIEEISSSTAMTTTDIIHTLQTLGMLKYYKGQHIICLTEAVVEKYDRQKARKRIRIDPSKLLWKPPVFTAAQLRFAW
ncbi:NuA4 histone acetyltransferase complex catalytic subunit ESA1 [Sugiyamaella lignohabitans]|uniref:Histone acetyltransferase ESA1 n=1 Tax=Sugiyamaella lignohabitans TaxID=796027 RepID=A0A167C1V8_9ASCO|nr:NuA4 histone acetyltransferase complex catalytic subunit ESA1 [Sugiyamaella lignohabitans]ANB11115.1 NuA4 histone acetyltransferase complex catalytic subunit ESA1 [Sugiyamaella lignohabitans]